MKCKKNLNKTVCPLIRGVDSYLILMTSPRRTFHKISLNRPDMFDSFLLSSKQKIELNWIVYRK